MKGNAKSSPSAVVGDVVVLVCAFAFTANAQRVAAPAGARAADQGSRIAFSADREGQGAPDEIYLMDAAGTGERRVTPTSDSCGNSVAPRWSPTGHQIAFHCFTPPHNSGIFVINPDGTGLRRVTPPDLAAAFASWSPDGRRIAFGNPDSSQVYVVNVDGSGLRQLTTGTRPGWAPDGKHIAFNKSGPDGTQIYVTDVDARTEAIRLTTLGTNAGPRWSPDGRKITFESTRDGNREVYMMNADGADQVRLTHYPGIDAFPSWSADGRRIVFHRQLCDPSNLGGQSPNGSELFVIDADGSHDVRLTHGACQGPEGTFSASSTFSAFASWAPAIKR